MSKKAFRAAAVLFLIVVVAVSLFITVVSADEAGVVADASAAQALALNDGSIRGAVFYDGNRNGVWDAGEAGMAGQTVTVYSPGRWSYAYTSGGDGTFGPAGLSPAYYSVKITVPTGYVATTVTEYQGLGVGIDKSVFTGLYFGLTSAHYSPPQTGGPPAVRPPIYYPPPPPPPVAPPPHTCTYVVQPGDSLGLIAQRYGTTVAALANLNHISNWDLIYAGQVLHLPGCAPPPPPPPPPTTTTYVVVHGDTLYSIAVRFGTTVTHLSALNGISNPDLIYAGQVLIVPVG